MTPEFSQVIDPIFLTALGVMEEIDSKRPVQMNDVRLRLQKCLDDGDASQGPAEMWQLSKYGLTCWIDDYMTFSDWGGQQFWKDNCLEVHYFGNRRAYNEFYEQARTAAQLPVKDALEVFYLCVVMGFRGCYRDNQGRISAANAGLPDSLENWAAEVSRQIETNQGLPEVDMTPRLSGDCSPFKGQATLVSVSLTTACLAAGVAGYFYFKWLM
jgi:type VI secretion system protein ImpK